MIKPHQANELNALFVTNATEREALLQAVNDMPTLLLNSAAAANAVMLGAGYFTPLTGYMNKADALSVAAEMRTADGVFWPVPVVNRTDNVAGLAVGQQIALTDPNVDGNPVIAVQTITAIDTLSEAEIQQTAEQIFATTDPEHPGVATWTSLGEYVVAGPIQVLNYSYFEKDFESFRTAQQIRDEIQQRGWEKVVAFQTRNPMHRAHEELCRMAMEQLAADGIVIHMLLGKLKAGDIPADVRNDAIATMVEHYFPENTVMITGYGFDMLYAGPREAVLHALFRQNMGATHLIVGRDHAGVGDYYGDFDAQTIFDDIPADAMQIEIFRADHTAYSKKLDRVVMMRDVPDHTKEDFVLLSGTKVREMLGNGTAPPPEFSRPEVAQILMDYYQSL